MRCFVAAWPDETTRLALASLSDDVRQRTEHRRATHVNDLHLTLAFIGDLADEVAFDLADSVAKLRFKPFGLQLDKLGFVEEESVVWVGAASDTPKPLVDLADRVRALLDRMNVAYDRRPLRPHVTLLRGVKKFAAERVAPILWRIESIALYRSAPPGRASRYVRVAP